MKASAFLSAIGFSSLLLVLMCCRGMAKPVRGPATPPVEEHDSDNVLNDTGLSYERYLRQVVEVLESDPNFRHKLETANVSDIKSGKVALYLDMVNHTVRTRLDEIKRREITRLQELVRAQIKGMTDPQAFRKSLPSHLDLGNPHSFEVKDLQTLIKKTTEDLEELDKKRREEFKEYEMEKKFEEEEKISHMSEEDKLKERERIKELKEKHKKHPKVHHPGSKDQFEEVWDKVDHLEDQEFNPRTFFFTHDINGDLVWSIEEVNAVLQRELDKVYDARKSPEEDDPIEREEEMNRMREHVFKEMDKDRNQLISLQEFLDYTGKQGENEHFKEDEEWKTLDEEGDLFTDDEYERFLQEHHAQPGVIDPPSDLHFQPEHQQFQQQPPQAQQPPQGQQQFQQPPQGQQQFQQPPQGQQQFQQPPQGQQQFQQPPQGQQQFQQPPQGQQQFQQPPQGQQQFQQPPQGQQQFQQPPQGQQFQQPPQGQQQFQQPPQGQQQFQQPPQGQQQFQQPPQGQQQQLGMNQMSVEQQQKLQEQLKTVQAQLAEQQKIQNQPVPPVQ